MPRPKSDLIIEKNDKKRNFRALYSSHVLIITYVSLFHSVFLGCNEIVIQTRREREKDLPSFASLAKC